MATLELDIVGKVPANLDLKPMECVFAALTASDLKLPEGTINVALVDDAKSRQLNHDYSGHDYATDVLSFSYIEDGGQPIDGVIGEMAISTETAQRQANEADTSLAEEIALLALHGTLHLAGHDHQTPEDQAKIGDLQAKIMKAAGYRYREFAWE